MIFNDNPKQTFESRIIDTVNYLKYCRHKARNLNSTESVTLLQHCLVNRILRMPDNNEIVMDAIRHALHPKRNFSTSETTSSEATSLETMPLETAPLETTSTETISAVTVNKPTPLDQHKKDISHFAPVPPRLDKPDTVTDFSDVADADPLNTILEIFYGAPMPAHSPDPQKIEKVISTLRLLTNRIKDTEYRLIDVLPQLGEVYEAREDITRNVLAQTIDNLFNILNVEKFQDVKLKSHLNTKIKQKAFLFDLLSQDFHRLKSQQEKEVYLDDALKLYRHELKSLGID